METSLESMQPSAKPRKRSRVTLSCTNCRHSKQRCDREIPCMTCILRGKQDTCYYGSISEKNQLSPVVESTFYGTEARNPFVPAQHTPRQDLTSIGYSNVNVHNTLGIVKRLEQLQLGDTLATPVQQSQGISLAPSSADRYRAIVSQLPCPSCVRILVDVFFAEVNWQYSLLDRSYFDDQLEEYYTQPVVPLIGSSCPLSSERLVFPSLLFQVLALAIQLFPEGNEQSLHSQCIASCPDGLDSKFSESAGQLLSLFDKEAINLTFIQSEFLRVAWTKNQGHVIEAWHGLAQVVLDAQEMGLHRDDGKVEAVDAETTCEQLWMLVMRRRIMVNLYLWDSQIGIVLGKSMNLTLSDCSIIPPMDCHIPQNRRVTAPSPRGDFDKPTQFSQRLIEYQLQVHLNQIRALETEGPYPRDYTKVERLHQLTLDYMDALPPIFRFENPDTSFDAECPWLVPQRNYLCASTWLFLIVLHRPYIFSMPRSRSEVMRAAIVMLRAEQRHFLALKPHHYRLFILSYISVEPCVSMLAILITYPDESSEFVLDALQAVRETLVRLNIIRATNRTAGPGADLIQTLLARAETVRGHHSHASIKMHTITTSPDKLMGLHSKNAVTKPVSHSSQASRSVADQSLTQFQQSSRRSSQAINLPNNNADLTLSRRPFLPTADIVYNNSQAADPSDVSYEDNTALGYFPVGSELQQQFVDTFDEEAFWSFVNESL